MVLTRHNGSVELQGNKRGIGVEKLLHIAAKLRLHCKADATLVNCSELPRVAQIAPELPGATQMASGGGGCSGGHGFIQCDDLKKQYPETWGEAFVHQTEIQKFDEGHNVVYTALASCLVFR